MNRENIIRMAREAGGLPDPMVFIGAYERFAGLVAASEREACAKVCDEYSKANMESDIMCYVLDHCATAIRARGETK